MNTLEYFLSALRPAPPPSPRASTSELPISAALSPASDVPDEVAELQAAEPDPAAEVDADERAQRARDEVAEADEQPVLPPLRAITPSRQSSRKGKARAAAATAPVIPPGSAAVEDPIRDGETVKTELERDEGVEAAFVDHDGSAPSRPPAAPPAYNGTVALSDPEKGVAPAGPPPSSAEVAVMTKSSTAWPWMTRLVRWWPFRLSVSFYVLVRRFLSLFGLSYAPRPGYNALLAPSALSTEAGDSASLDEKGTPSKRRARIASLALSLSQRSLPPSSRTLSPSPSPTPTPTSIPRAPLPPPKLTPKTLVLDLDETLIHSTSRSGGAFGKRGAPKGLKTRVVEVVLDGRSTVYTVYKRPWVDFFLRKVRVAPIKGFPALRSFAVVTVELG